MAAIPHASVGDVIPETSVDHTSPRITAQHRAAVGTASARREGVHPQAQSAPAGARTSAARLSAIPLSADRILAAPPSDLFQADALDRTRTRSVAHASIHMAASADMGIAGSAAAGAETAGADMAVGTAGAEALDTGEGMVTAEGIGPATVGAAASSLGADGVGASASAGRIMEATGAQAGPTVGTPGGTTLTGIPPGRLITTTRRTRTPGTTIRHLTIRTRRMTMRRTTMTRRRATQLRRAWILRLYTSTSMTTLARARIVAV